MKKTYEKPMLFKRQKLSAVTAQQATSGAIGPTGPTG
ncbi:putative RiPP precursor [Mesorhizobium sp. M7A.F.Ca.US.008.03.1.1]|nr:putative RiPP precursor [Mesorhizobium sp. M7A.F.Ca.US.008.03.1.1]RUW63371.1 putative RiPP precursor [Mesorhizobium sp. M7A.F.Ca.US.008.03.1.1]